MLSFSLLISAYLLKYFLEFFGGPGHLQISKSGRNKKVALTGKKQSSPLSLQEKFLEQKENILISLYVLYYIFCLTLPSFHIYFTNVTVSFFILICYHLYS